MLFFRLIFNTSISYIYPMEPLLCLLYSTLFIIMILKWKFFSVDALSKSFFALIFILKIASGLSLWLIYTYYYTDRSTADIYKYFDDSSVIFGSLKNSFLDFFKLIFWAGDETHLKQYVLKMDYWYREFEGNAINEDRTMIRVNALFRLFSFGYFNVHTVFFSCLSLIGLTAIYRTFSKFLSGRKRIFAILLFLFPSLLFWGSGVLKESLVLFAVGILVYSFSKMLEGNFLKNFIFVLIFTLLLLLIKSYMLLVLIPGFLIWMMLKLTGENYAFIKFLLGISVCIAGAFLIPKINLAERIVTKQKMFINIANGGTHLMHHNKFVYIKPEIKNPITFRDEKRYCKINDGVQYQYWLRENNKDTLAATSENDTASYWIFYSQPPSGSRINIGRLENIFFSFLKNAPLAFWNSLARPYPWEAKSVLLILPALENLLILLLIILAVSFSSYKKCNKELFFFCLSAVIFLFLLIGYTTPVIGAIVRYKIPALPFLFVFLLLVIDSEKIRNKLPFLKPFFT